MHTGSLPLPPKAYISLRKRRTARVAVSAMLALHFVFPFPQIIPAVENEAQSPPSLVSSLISSALQVDSVSAGGDHDNSCGHCGHGDNIPPGIAIGKWGPVTTAPGAIIRYRLRITNTGPIPAVNIAVTDPIFDGLLFLPEISDPSCHVVTRSGWLFRRATPAIVCAPFALPPGVFRSMQLSFRVPDNAPCDGIIANRASVTAQSGLLCREPAIATAVSPTLTTQIVCPPPPPPPANLSVTKAGPATVLPGGRIQYAVTAANNGPGPAPDIVVTDPVFNGLTFVPGASDPACHLEGPNVICAGFGLPPGATRNFILVFDVPPTAVCDSQILDQASIASPLPDPDPTNNTSQMVVTTVTCPVPTPDVAISKSGPPTIERGGILSYSLTAINVGNAPARHVVIADPIPPGLQFNPAASSSRCVVDGMSILCNNFDLAPGEARSFVLAFNVTPAIDCDETIVNQASVSTASTDLVPSNNESPIVSTVAICPPAVAADLEVEKSGPPTAPKGGQALYTITVRNLGPAVATDVTVTDDIPPGFLFFAEASDPDCSFDGSQVVCDGGNLPPGAARTFTLKFIMPASPAFCGEIITNTSEASAREPDPNPANNIDQAAVQILCPVVPVVDLSVTKEGPATAPKGGQMTYLVTVENLGPATATHITTSDPIPNGLIFNPAASDPDCVQDGTDVLCDDLILAPGTHRTYTLAFAISPSPALCNQTIVNGATAAGLEPDVSTANNSDAVSTVITCPATPAIDLQVEKSGPLTAQKGGQIGYTVAVRNLGPGTATSVTVTDPIPAGLMFNPALSDLDCVQEDTDVICDNLTLPPGAQKIYNLTFIVSNSPTLCNRTIVNTAMATGLQPDLDAVNNSASVSTQILCAVTPIADLEVSKLGPATAPKGGQITYAVSVKNLGPTTATNVTTSDPIPAGLVFNGPLSDPDCIQDGTDIVCDNLTLPVGGQRTYSLTFDISASPALCGQMIVNGATAAGLQPDPVTVNNTATMSTQITCPVTPTIDLGITKTSDPTCQRAGLLSYAITVGNAGSALATNVVVSDPIPPNLTFIPASSDPACSLQGATVVCTAGSIAPAQSKTLGIVFAVIDDASVCGTSIVNIASVEADQPDPNATNDTASNTTIVDTCVPVPTQTVDLRITKTGPARAELGEEIVYVATVRNLGNTSATNVVLTDAIPPGLIYKDSSSDPTCSLAGAIITCPLTQLAPNAQKAFIITYTVAETPALCSTAVVNTVSIASAEPDVNPANNTAVAQTTISCPTQAEVADLTVMKVGQSSAVPGGILAYIVSVKNLGPATASHVVTTDPIPAGLMFDPNLSDSDCTQVDGNIVCTTQSMIPNSMQLYGLVFRVANDTALCAQIVQNIATTSSDSSDPVGSNNTSAWTANIRCPCTTACQPAAAPQTLEAAPAVESVTPTLSGATLTDVETDTPIAPAETPDGTPAPDQPLVPTEPTAEPEPLPTEEIPPTEPEPAAIPDENESAEAIEVPETPLIPPPEETDAPIPTDTTVETQPPPPTESPAPAVDAPPLE